VVVVGESPTRGAHSEHRALLATAVAAAVRGADVIKRKSGELSALTWTAKSPTDFVSEVDLAAEAAIREVILGRHPGASIVGEELSPADARGAVTFIVDPLDGTTNFLHGYPAYAVSIGVVLEGELCAGAVLHVVNGDLFTATLGGGARRAGQRVAVSRIADPPRALIGTGFPFKHPDLVERYLRQFARILRATAGVRRAGSAALDLADVACGRFDAFWELHLAPWDVGAGILLVREAGGIVTDADGRPAMVDHGPIVAGNPAMHGWLLEAIQEPITES
jgi:myo-inositol-1(or 4)-monophosphatase